MLTMSSTVEDTDEKRKRACEENEKEDGAKRTKKSKGIAMSCAGCAWKTHYGRYCCECNEYVCTTCIWKEELPSCRIICRACRELYQECARCHLFNNEEEMEKSCVKCKQRICSRCTWTDDQTRKGTPPCCWKCSKSCAVCYGCGAVVLRKHLQCKCKQCGEAICLKCTHCHRCEKDESSYDEDEGEEEDQYDDEEEE